MTREEAIEYLNTLYMALAVFPNQQISLGNVDEMKESVNMAIEALELIPDNATNGDMIKAMFPDADISLNNSCFEGVVNRYGFDEKWWNALYRKK